MLRDLKVQKVRSFHSDYSEPSPKRPPKINARDNSYQLHKMPKINSPLLPHSATNAAKFGFSNKDISSSKSSYLQNSGYKYPITKKNLNDTSLKNSFSHHLPPAKNFSLKIDTQLDSRNDSRTEGNVDPSPKNESSAKSTLKMLTATLPLKMKQQSYQASLSSLSTVKRKDSIDKSPSSSRGSSANRRDYSAPKKSPLSVDKAKSISKAIFKKEPAAKSYKVSKGDDSNSSFSIPDIGPTKHSLKESGCVRAYAANTFQGLVRNYNEDRVSIILNISKPTTSTFEGTWPSCSYFAIYDGHGGPGCADYLRDNLHLMITRNSFFPMNPAEAIRRGFAECEGKFIEKAQENPNDIDRSGSCAIVVLIVDDICYIANVGDSRAVMSMKEGKETVDLSRDHKPSDPDERARIIRNGGNVYQSQNVQPVRNNNDPFGSTQNTILYGPVRVFPGRLSVSRTFGDIEAKLTKFNGKPNVVTAEPEIRIQKITSNSDFIILGSDGIYDKITSEQAIESIWSSKFVKLQNVHQQAAAGVEYLMKKALLLKTTDNITVVMIAMDGFKNSFQYENLLKGELEMSRNLSQHNMNVLGTSGNSRSKTPVRSTDSTVHRRESSNSTSKYKKATFAHELPREMTPRKLYYTSDNRKSASNILLRKTREMNDETSALSARSLQSKSSFPSKRL